MQGEALSVPNCSLVLCTAPPEAADALARRIVQERLAACVNLLPGVISHYLWKGRAETSGETLLLIKTTAERVTDLIVAIPRWHPYELPEVIAVEIRDGLPPYLRWLAEGSSPGA